MNYQEKLQYYVCGFDIRGTITEINKQNGAVYSVNRMEEVEVFSIQTFLNYSEPLDPEYFKKYDLFSDYSSLGKDYTLDSKYIYMLNRRVYLTLNRLKHSVQY